MTTQDVIDACSGVFALFTDVKAVEWSNYALVLAHVNPGDLDDALLVLRQTHGFRNAPLPAEVLNLVNEAKQARLSKTYRPDGSPVIGKDEGELKVITIPGIGSIKVRVLPDDHPALRVACLDCHDSGWRPVPHHPDVQDTVTRCHCWRTNPILQRHREQNARYVKERGDR